MVFLYSSVPLIARYILVIYVLWNIYGFINIFKIDTYKQVVQIGLYDYPSLTSVPHAHSYNLHMYITST